MLYPEELHRLEISCKLMDLFIYIFLAKDTLAYTNYKANYYTNIDIGVSVSILKMKALKFCCNCMVNSCDIVAHFPTICMASSLILIFGKDKNWII